MEGSEEAETILAQAPHSRVRRGVGTGVKGAVYSGVI